MKKILLIDNYDSFSYTIVFYLKELGYQCKIVKNDEFKKAKDLTRFDFSHLIISPGPNSPAESKLSLKAIQYFKKDKKILGICLGHQCIGEIFGGKITPMPYPMQGKISRLHLKKNAKKSLLFKGIKNKSKICLYHSLHISKMPKSCEILALNDENIIMAIKHKKYEIYGVQFHPEAILSQNGKKLLKNFMKI